MGAEHHQVAVQYTKPRKRQLLTEAALPEGHGTQEGSLAEGALTPHGHGPPGMAPTPRIKSKSSP